jgi:hypothetical protein
VRPTVSDEAWAAASPPVKQAAVGATLQTTDDYARASAAVGGFDPDEAHLTRTNLRLDTNGWKQAANGLRAAPRLAGTHRGRIGQTACEGSARIGRCGRRRCDDAVGAIRMGQAEADGGPTASPRRRRT